MSEFAEWRLKAGLTLAEAASAMKVSQSTVYRYERGSTPISQLALDALDRKIVTGNKPDNADFRVIDLFAGIGGLRLGFEAIGGNCVFTSEWDKNSQLTYSKNSRGDDHAIKGDIREFSENPDRIPEHDVLLAGFPCQASLIADVSKSGCFGLMIN